MAIYSAAALAIGVDAMLRNAQVARNEVPELALPTAIVAPPAAIELCRSYCSLMCEAGFWRRAFLDHESALRWAAEHAQIREELLAQRRLTQTEADFLSGERAHRAPGSMAVNQKGLRAAARRG